MVIQQGCENHMAMRQLWGQAALGPDSPGARQPWSQTALEPDSPGTRQSWSQAPLWLENFAVLLNGFHCTALVCSTLLWKDIFGVSTYPGKQSSVGRKGKCTFRARGKLAYIDRSPF